MAYKVPLQKFVHTDAGNFTSDLDATELRGPGGQMVYAYGTNVTSGYTSKSTALRNYTRLVVPANGTLDAITLGASLNGTWSSVSPNNMLCQVYRWPAADIDDTTWNTSFTPTKIAEVSISEDYENKIYSQRTEVTSGNTVTAGDYLAWFWTCSNSAADLTANCTFFISLEFSLES
tara:strand:+ start:591 stop:1118 length:528 start_codon:yes stop_codon:yes gene_type:complete